MSRSASGSAADHHNHAALAAVGAYARAQRRHGGDAVQSHRDRGVDQHAQRAVSATPGREVELGVVVRRRRPDPQCLSALQRGYLHGDLPVVASVRRQSATDRPAGGSNGIVTLNAGTTFSMPLSALLAHGHVRASLPLERSASPGMDGCGSGSSLTPVDPPRYPDPSKRMSGKGALPYSPPVIASRARAMGPGASGSGRCSVRSLSSAFKPSTV